MQEMVAEIFGSFSRYIIFFHIVSAMLLVGSLFTLRFIVSPVILTIESQEERYEKVLNLLKNFAIVITAAMLILVSASIFMSVGLGFEYGNPSTYVMINTKEAIWIFIVFNFVYMGIKYKYAKRALKEKEYIQVHENIILIVSYLVPLNFILSLIAVFMGIILRGF